jgi:nucleotide-binding universal stress UspA family protein
MPMVGHILFPYDFSDQGARVVPFVRALAGCFNARITLLAVVPPTFESVPEGMGARLRVGDEPTLWRQNLQSRLDDALVQELAGLTVERVADGGDAAVRIVDFAHTHAVDLIMMPTHGLGLFRSLLVGSVTSKVLHDAKCPVWTAAHARTQTAPELPKHIVCALGATPDTAALAQWANDFSTRVGATLTLLHVVGPISDWPSLESERRLQELVRDEARGNILSMLKSAIVVAAPRVAVGEIVRTVAEEAQQERADLMIIGRGSVSEPFGRLRTHAFGIIQRSPCPVISV